MSATPPPEGYLTRTAAAERLGCWPQRVTSMIKREEIAGYELNGRILVSEADVDALVAAAAAKPRKLTPEEAANITD
jgi:hypothetical protein